MGARTINPFVVLDRAANRDNRRGCRGPREVARSRHYPGDQPICGRLNDPSWEVDARLLLGSTRAIDWLAWP